MRNLLKSVKGFTLIELLIVIAVLGVLAAVVLVAIDPVEQLARGRDSGRKTSIAQVGHALQAYFTASGNYPQGNGAAVDWATTLKNSGDVKVLPSAGAAAAPACAVPGAVVNNICYKPNAAGLAATDFVLYSHMESKTERNKTAGAQSCNNAIAQTWYVYSSIDGRAGTVCLAAGAEPAVAAQTFTAQ